METPSSANDVSSWGPGSRCSISGENATKERSVTRGGHTLVYETDLIVAVIYEGEMLALEVLGASFAGKVLPDALARVCLPVP